MKNGYLVEGSMVVLGGVVAPLMMPDTAHATTVFDVASGQTSVVSSYLSSGHVSGVLVSGGGSVLFVRSNSYTGGTVIDGGSTLYVNKDSALGYTTGTVTLGDSTTSGTLSFEGISGVASSQISSTTYSDRGLLINAGGGTIETETGIVVSSGTNSVTSQYTEVWEGVISGTGLLTVTGGGKLYLTNKNVWTGGTLVEDGSTLEISKQYNLGADTNTLTLDNGTLQIELSRAFVDPISLGSGGGTIDVTTHTDIWSGSITGTGGLTVASTEGGSSTTGTSGTLVLKGAETYTGGTVVEGGTLRLDSASLLGDLTVTSKYYSKTVLSGSGTSSVVSTTTGTLAGIGSVEGTVTVTNGGSVSPGIDGAGTLTVGNYVQSSGTTLTINVGSSGSSELVVTSNATLAGDLKLQYQDYAKAGTYQYMSVGGTTSGSFTSVTDNLLGAGMESNVNTSTNTIVLTQNTALPSGDLPTLIIAAADAARDDAQLANRLILDRMQSVRTTALAERDEVALSNHHQVRNRSPYGLWVSPLGGFGSASGGNGAPGYSTSKYGFAMGIDHEMAPGWVDGIALEYTHQSVSQSGGGNASIGTPRIEAYTGFWRGPYAFDFAIGDGSAGITTRRSLHATLNNIYNGSTITQSFAETASGKHSINETTAAFQASANYLIGYKWALSPALGVKYARLTETGFTETGTDYFNYKISSRTENSIRPFVDVSASRRYYMQNGWALLPTLGVGAEAEAGSRNATLKAQTFGDAQVWTITGVSPSRFAVNIDLGLALQTSKSQSFGVKLLGTEGSSNRDQTIEAQYRLRF